MIDRLPARGETIAGTTLMLAPLWGEWLHTLNQFFGFGATFFGFCIGAHGFYRLFRRRKNGRASDAPPKPTLSIIP